MDMNEVMPVGTRIQLVPGCEWYARQHKGVIGYSVSKQLLPDEEWDVKVFYYYYNYKHIMPYDGPGTYKNTT